MALKRWLWITGPVLAAALVAIALLPPRTPTGENVRFEFIWGPGYSANSGEAERSQFTSDVQAAKRVQQWYLRRAKLADSILTVARGARALRSADGQVTLVYETPLTPDSARFWLGAATRELALFPKGPTPGMRLVVALLSDTMRERPANRAGYEWGVQELMDQAASAGACVVTVNLLGRQGWARPSVGRDSSGRPVSRVLGACALYARFGLPRAGVSRWAVQGLGHSWGDPLTVLLREARHRVLKIEIPHTSKWNPWYGEVRWAEVGCLRGAATLCRRAADLGPEPDSPYPFYFNPLLPRGKVIAHLLATGNPEQFAAFWRSPQPPAEALAGAYGEPAGRLAMAALQHWYSAPAPAGPWGSARRSLAGVAWAALALAVAAAAGRRWRTEL